jgi:lipopolysaccharide transport system permease protein
MRTESVVIEPSRRFSWDAARELFRYRELLYFFVWRDLKVRYAQTSLGVTWAVIQPVALTVIFSIFLGALAGVPSDGIPYPLFVLSGLVVWTLFSQSLVQASNSLVNSSNLVSKIYFPRLLLPLSAAGAPLVDFALSSLVLVATMVYYGRIPTASIAWLPVAVLLALVTALGIGTWLAALNVRYRDVRHAVPFFIQLWLWSSPVAYPISIVPTEWRALYSLNPIAGSIELFRWALLGGTSAPTTGLLVSFGAATGALFLGLVYFRSVERSFADVI